MKSPPKRRTSTPIKHNSPPKKPNVSTVPRKQSLTKVIKIFDPLNDINSEFTQPKVLDVTTLPIIIKPETTKPKVLEFSKSSNDVQTQTLKTTKPSVSTISVDLKPETSPSVNNNTDNLLDSSINCSINVMNNLKSEIESLKQIINNDREENANHITSLRNEIHELLKIINKKDDEIENYIKIQTFQEENTNEFQKMIEKLQNENESLYTAIKEYKKEHKLLISDKNESDSIAEEVVQLKSNNKDLTSALKSLESVNDNLTVINTNLKEESVLNQEKLETLRKVFTKSQNQAEEVIKKLESKVLELTTLQSKSYNESDLNKTNSLEWKILELEKSLKDSDNENKELRNRLFDAQNPGFRPSSPIYSFDETEESNDKKSSNNTPIINQK